MGSFQILEHTGEVGILARGRSLEEAFVQAAKGMFSLMVDPQTIEEEEERWVEVEATDREALLVAWLNHLIYLFDVEGLLLCHFRVEEVDEKHLKAVCHGEKLSPERHQLNLAIKAATYHMVEVREENGWWARVILDI